MYDMKIKNTLTLQTSFSYYMIGMPLIFLISLFFYYEFNQSIATLILGFLFIYFFTVLFVIRYYGLMSLYAIFLYTSTFFLYDCFWFTLFDESKNFLIQTFPRRYYIPDEIGIKFIFASELLTYVMHLTYCLINKKRFIKKQIIIHEIQYEKVGMAIMLIFLIPSIAKLYIQLRYVMQYGYLVVFTGGLTEIKYPFWTAGANLLFITGFSLFVAGNPSKRKFIIFAFLLFVLMALNGAKGQRGLILGPLVGLLYWYIKKYNINIKIKTIIILFFFVIAITYFMGNLRNSYGEKSKSSVQTEKLFDLVSNVLYSQTTSRTVPLKIIQGDLPFHNYPFIISPFFTYLNLIIYPSNGQDTVSVEKYNDISQIVMYSVSPQAHFDGRGYGGAFLAEAYDCGGYLGVIFWGIILAVFLVFCDFSNLNIKNKYIPFIFLIILNFAMLPRNRLFTVVDTHFPKILLLLLILPIIKSKKIWRLSNV